MRVNINDFLCVLVDLCAVVVVQTPLRVGCILQGIFGQRVVASARSSLVCSAVQEVTAGPIDHVHWRDERRTRFASERR